MTYASPIRAGARGLGEYKVALSSAGWDGIFPGLRAGWTGTDRSASPERRELRDSIQLGDDRSHVSWAGLPPRGRGPVAAPG